MYGDSISMDEIADAKALEVASPRDVGVEFPARCFPLRDPARLPLRLAMNPLIRRAPSVARLLLILTAATVAEAAEVRVIYPDSEPEIGGKEVDWIYGDYLMRNDQLTITIAAPIATRDANLTVRDIGASILDMTINNPSNDQLTRLYPCRRTLSVP